MKSSEVFESVSGISEDDIAQARSMIDEPLRIRQFNHEATLDTIHHFASGIGDENPLWCDEEYASRGPFGTIIAPPCFLYSVFAAGVAPGFPGLQTFFGTGSWEFVRPIKRGETIQASARMTDMYERSGAHVDRMIVQVGETIYTSGGGETVGRYVSKALRVPRATTGQGLTYKPRDQYVYSGEELAEIERQTLGWTRRGNKPLYWEDVKVGEILPVLVKGPLDLTTIITYYSGAMTFGYASCDTQWRNRFLARTDPELLPNNRSAGWVAEMTWPGMGHYVPEVAQAIGMPGVYDNGWMRTSWMSQLLTDWIGDLGWLQSLEAKLVRPNLMGDTTWFEGKVVGKQSAPQLIVEVELEGRNQLNEITCVGSAFVRLPAKDSKLALTPFGRHLVREDVHNGKYASEVHTRI